MYPLLFGAVGLIIIMAIPQGRYPGASYVMLFVVAIGLDTTIAGVVSWCANNLEGSWKRAVGMAILISIGNLGGALGTNTYLEKQALEY